MSDLAHPPTIPIPSAQVDPADVSAARVVNRLLQGEAVEFAALPRTPTDWYGLAATIATPPDPKKRPKALSRYLGNTPDRARIEAALRIAEQEPEPGEPEPEKPSFILSIMDADELDACDFPVEWLIEDILVAGQPAVIGAAKKGLKTSIAIDLMVSVASGTAFLGEFGVPKAQPVLMLSGESGGFATKMTARRVCETRGFQLRDLKGRFFTGLELPRLNDPSHIAAFADLIRARGIKLVVIDPLYLCLVSAGPGGKPIDPKNLFEVGPLLQSVSRACLEAGATPVLIHHNKISGAEPYAVPDLSNLSFAGIQEYTRQWVLLGRRERHVPGSGIHKLWLTVGGSSGHSGEWSVDVDEGTMNRDFSGRKWDVRVHTAAEIRREEEECKQAEQRSKSREKEIALHATHRQEEERIREAMLKLGGSTSRSKAYGAAGLNSSKGPAALARMEAAGTIIEVQIATGRGKGSTPIMGIGLAELRRCPTNSDVARQNDLSG